MLINLCAGKNRTFQRHRVRFNFQESNLTLIESQGY